MDQSGQPDNLHPILSDLVLFDGASVPLTFTGDGKLLFKGQRQQCLTVEKEVIGFALEGSRIRLKTVVEKRDRICCFGSSGDLVRQSFVFEPQSQDSLTLWSQKLRDYIDSLGRPKRLLIFVNPFGGKKSATKIFSEDVKPYLEDADIHITLIETKHQLHAKEVAKTMDLSKYDGIVCVSGDGILVEVVNGLLEREDWSAAIKMPIGLIPAGTGNGMVKSLLHAAGEPCSASNAILTVIRGYKRSLDVATISQGKTRFFSVLMLAWGLIADIDIESEKYRWMGSARIDFYAVQRVFCLRHYNGRISFVPAPGFEDYGEPTSYHGESTSEESQTQELSLKTEQHGYLGSGVKLENMRWRTISGPFVSIWLHNVPWGGEDIMAAPDAKFSDGYLDLIMLKDVPKLALLSLMSNMNDGNYIKSPHITYIKVKAFLLEPGARVDDPTKEGIIDSDGEVIARGNGTYMGDQKTLMTYNKLQITVDQGLATLFAPK
ncbi:Sphingosine kinase 2 [Hibiscus syriacus]|uniref:sphingosine kinase n=2 Tax=Hibiscus syriacus TaxID=106335 RepID=A0A6A3BT27_HIBSY|nr:sphingosine kinase 1-like isoform X1 [Hibiscus syriacus]KAE8719843.1 Sphingosine kinase 2 [Hibiscus syriacus]